MRAAPAARLAKGKLRDAVASPAARCTGRGARRACCGASSTACASRAPSSAARRAALVLMEGRFEQRVIDLEARSERDGLASGAERDAALEKLRRAADAKLRKERQLRRRGSSSGTIRGGDAAAGAAPSRDRNARRRRRRRRRPAGCPAQRAGHICRDRRRQGRSRVGKGQQPGPREGLPTHPRGASRRGVHVRRRGQRQWCRWRRGCARRRPPVPKRNVGATPTLLEEEAKELREALSVSRHEKDVLQCEVHALRLELETTRELLAQ